MSAEKVKETHVALVDSGDDVESKSSTDSPPSATIDPAVERKLLLKLDLCIYPILFIVYMMSFLDRINISNAKIQGMALELDISGNHFNIALFVSLPSSCSLAKLS